MRMGSTKISNQLSEKRSRLQSLLCEDTVQTMVRMKPKYFPEYLEKKQDKGSLRKTVTLKSLILNRLNQKVISTNEIVENSTFQARFYAETYNGYNYSKCMSSCFLFQCYPAVYLTMNDCFHVYVLEFQTIFPCVFKTIWM